jgi:hypothetical protein
MTPRDLLVQDIEAAFATVERGAGLTLHEAAEFEGNDYCTAEERACVRAFDPETRWQDIPDSSLAECLDFWAFEDEGFRFHLPACLRWYLRHPEELGLFRGGLLYALLSPSHSDVDDRAGWERSWNSYTLEQKHVIARFLEYMASEVPEQRQEARLTWRCYWHQFSQPR